MQEPLVDSPFVLSGRNCYTSSGDHFSKKSGRTTFLGDKLDLHVLVAMQNQCDLVVAPGVCAPGHIPIFFNQSI